MIINSNFDEINTSDNDNIDELCFFNYLCINQHFKTSNKQKDYNGSKIFSTCI